MALRQIEADVVLVAEHVDGAETTITVYPLWECEMDAKGLADMAANVGLAETERAGSGYTRVTIHDYRTERTQA